MDILGFGAGNIAALLTVLLGIATSVLGGKLGKVYKILKQLVNMVEDDTITKEELKKFVKAVKNL